MAVPLRRRRKPAAAPRTAGDEGADDALAPDGEGAGVTPAESRRGGADRPFTERLVERASLALDPRTDRRSILKAAAVFGSALATGGVGYILRPGTAYASVCGGDASCTSGFTAFCCTVHGTNTCPPSSFPAGWWKIDASPFCGGQARYIVDCNATCPTQCTCRCASGTCDERQTCCSRFRYGQCNTQIACAGPIVCRVALCTPPWVWSAACTTTSRTDNRTATHNAPCLPGSRTPTKEVFSFGASPDLGSMVGRPLNKPIVGMAATATGSGYWLVASDGGIFAFGDAGWYGSTGGIVLNKPIVGMVATATGKGYWLVASDGGIFAFGDAGFYGSTGGIVLNKPVVGMAPTPRGLGYWLVASDGGIFAYGDAFFYGSTGGLVLNKPIVGMAPTPTGLGYWLVASDGGIFAFDAGFYGSTGGQALSSPITGMATTSSGRGYWLLAADGTIHPFGDAVNLGRPDPNQLLDGRAVTIIGHPRALGYWVAATRP